MTQPPPTSDRLIFTPSDVDLRRSPLRGSVMADTYALGAFNPGLTRLPNGNLLIMVRVAEALREPIAHGKIHAIRWTPDGYILDGYPTEGVNAKDPRAFMITPHHARVMGLTSLSWLLPVELSADGRSVLDVHYEKAIAPAASYQMYGVEDARISRIDGRYYMTACSVSPERQCTTLYTSRDGLDWRLEGIVLDHQNKDMVLFEGKVAGRFMALTRPLGDLYFAYPPDSEYMPGPAIQLAASPDASHWKPLDAPGIRPRKG
ncbi:MAG: glycosidase, partial [Pseudomonadota bacterium]